MTDYAFFLSTPPSELTRAQKAMQSTVFAMYPDERLLPAQRTIKALWIASKIKVKEADLSPEERKARAKAAGAKAVETKRANILAFAMSQLVDES